MLLSPQSYCKLNPQITKMKNSFAVILACGLASVLEALSIRYYEERPVQRNHHGRLYVKRYVTPADTQLIPHQYNSLPGFHVPAYTLPLPQVVLILYTPPVHYFIFSQAQYPVYQVAPFQPVQIDAAPSPDMGASDDPNVANAVILRTNEPPPPLVGEQSDESGDEETLTL